MAGRKEVPVDPAAGPVQRFAFELRKLRAETDGVTYRELALRAGYSVTTLSRAAGGEQLPTLPVVLAYVRACGGNSAWWEARWREAAEDVPPDDGSAPPYRGLARYEPDDSALFFGREQLTADLVELLSRRRFAAVFGASGSGKSSLLRAGLIPVLRRARDPRPSAIRILTPGERPARTHAQLLTPAGPETYVIVDQFEEVFTLCRDVAERDRFIEMLLTARQPGSGVRVLLAVRGDFYGRCAEHRGLAEALRDANLLAGAMSPAELRDAVVKPATASGLTVERALTSRLVEEVAGAPGGLPLLSHALLETWRLRRGKTLTLAGYEAAGRLDGAITRTAERVHSGFTEAQAATARRVLLRLIEPGDGVPDTRRPVQRTELPGDTGPVLEALTGARLLTLDGDTVELAHEALITAWPRLRGWIEEDRERLRVQRELTVAAGAWAELGCEKGALYRGSRLAAAQEYFGGTGSRGLIGGGFGRLLGWKRGELAGAGRGKLADRERGELTTPADTHCAELTGVKHATPTDGERGQCEEPAVPASTKLTAGKHSTPANSHRAELTDDKHSTPADTHRAELANVKHAAPADGKSTAPADTNRTTPANDTHSAPATTDRVAPTNGNHSPPATTNHPTPPNHKPTPPAATNHPELTLIERSFLDASLNHAHRGRRRSRLVLLSVVSALCLALLGTGLAVGQWRSAVGAQRLAESRQLAAQSGALLRSDPDRAALLAVRAYRTAATREATEALYAAASLPLRQRLVGGKRPVQAIALSPDGRTLAAYDADGTVQIRDLPGGRLRHTLAGLGGTRSMVFSPDGSVLAVAGAEIGLWDPATGEKVNSLAIRDGYVRGMDFHGRTLAVASPAGVRLWDTGTGRLRKPLAGLRDPEAVAFGPGGRTVAAAGLDGGVRVWDVATGRTVAVHEGWTRAEVVFSPDGQTYSITPDGGSVELRDVATGALRRTLGTGGRPAFAPDGRTLAVAGPGDTVRIWDAVSGAALASLTAGHHGRALMEIALGPDGTLVTSTNLDPSVRVQRWSAERPRATLYGAVGTYVADLAFGPGGRAVATVSERATPMPGDGSAQLWDVRASALVPASTPGEPPVQPRDAGTVALVPLSMLDEPSTRPRETGTTVRKTTALNTGPASGGTALGFTPDGRALVSRSVGNGVIEVRDLTTGRLLHSRRLGPVDKIAFSPDGTRLGAVGPDGTVQIWHLSTDTLRTIRTGDHHTLRTMAFTPDGRELALVTIHPRSERLTLLDTTTGRTRHTLDLSIGGSLSIAFSPDGRTLAAASGDTGTVQIRDPRTGRLQHTFDAGDQAVSPAFSPDGRTLATGEPGAVHLWDLATGRPRRTLPTRSYATPEFSPDGRTLAVVVGNSVELWDVDLPDPARAMREIREAVSG
ncbi:nSTAND1 domain-containing NTPase [Streptomyces acidiscabies]|uniref:nSTAND1 domain-containing NTPase n=1 Tax=Streptomyces acidiscabies TaxID=42234 RepID=UPI002116AD26|nr:PQQ-binding-like beta-propeller repeat protein [Streptomyces acidiscabies]